MSDVLCPSGGHWRFCWGVFRTFLGGGGGNRGEFRALRRNVGVSEVLVISGGGLWAFLGGALRGL